MDHSTFISLVSKFCVQIEGLSDRYREVVKLIDAEHALVNHSDLEGVESITVKKINLGNIIEKEVQQLFVLFEDIRKQVNQYYGPYDDDPMDLSGLVSRLSSIKIDANLEGKVLKFEISKLANAFKVFRELRSKYQPKLEMNRYLLSKVLRNHQETFRFWQSVAAESEATYGEKGMTKAQHAEPILRVKT